jgi:ribosomal protein L22
MTPPAPKKPDDEPKPKPRRRIRKPAAAKAEAETPSAESTSKESTTEEPKAKAKAKAKPKAEAKPKPEAAKPIAKAAEPKDSVSTPAARPAGRRRGARSSDGIPVVRAQARYVRTSARKARLVCDHIRGKSVIEARAILAFAPRAVARDWAKLLDSAVANAEHNHELVGDELRIHEVHADEGPTLKRFRPRAMGRATPIRKRTSHLSIALTPLSTQPLKKGR